MLEEALNKHFIQLFKGYENSQIHWDISEMPEMQADIEKLINWMSNLLDRGVISRAEYRVAIKYPERNDDSLDQLTVSQNVMALDDALISNREFDQAFRLNE